MCRTERWEEVNLNYITQGMLDDFHKKFGKDTKNQVAMNAVVMSGIEKTAADFQSIRRNRNVFSLNLKQGDITDQKMSGRCWMFAALNIMRFDLIKKYNLKNFEFSQSFPLFYDKLEKANYFLEAMLENLDEPLNGRLISYLLVSPLNDGGQWDMFANLINKYGAVPKDVMPESFSSSKTRGMNYYLTAKLREFACCLRTEHEKGAELESLYGMKEQMMYEIYQILCICLGTPPETFDFEIEDKDGTFICDRGITPKEFYDKYVGWNLDETISLIHAPTKDKPFQKCYTVKYLGNVKEGKEIRYLNLEMEYLKSAAVHQLKAGKQVWFGADVDHGMLFEEGVMDYEAYNAKALFGTEFGLSKGQRLDYGESMMNHAMVLTGVNLDEQGRPDRWKVENSWGKEKGKEGYYVMSDGWFDEYVFQIVAEKQYLSEEIRPYCELPLIQLEPWDPMGSLA